MHRTQIPKNQLVVGRWYVGRGRNGNVGLWTRMRGKLQDNFVFLVVGFKFHEPVIKFEAYFEKDGGCFQPFALIQEGTVYQPFGSDKGWDQHYAKILDL